MAAPTSLQKPRRPIRPGGAGEYRIGSEAAIRRASEADEARLGGLQKRAYVMEVPRIGAEPQPMAGESAGLLQAYEVWVVDGVEDGLAGALVLRTAPDHLLIWSVVVDPTQQGTGLGRRLLDFAE